MSHFAKLDDNNVVLEVNALSNHELVISKNTVDENGNVVVSLVESEDKGIAFLTAWSGGHTNWKQTSYNATFRGKFAGIGDIYDAETNEFRSPVVVPSVDTPVVEPVVEVQQTTAIEITTTDLPAITSAEIPALTSAQITGL